MVQFYTPNGVLSVHSKFSKEDMAAGCSPASKLSSVEKSLPAHF